MYFRISSTLIVILNVPLINSMYVLLGIAMLCEKTLYYTSSIGIRWDNITCSVQSTLLWALVASLKPSLRSGFKMKPLVPRVITIYYMRVRVNEVG